MSNTVIKVENLSKKYILSHQGRESYTSLRDVMANGARTLAKRLISPFTFNVSRFTDTQEEFYALRDVNFEINQGDRVGIIGRNGAGKSTLLKILSRITEPTSGRVALRGRVASLLEVGTGFHPELTGRENIYLNGAILGMGREEIKRKFDEIVAFAEIEKFLDTPVKRYSSGMYVRLAFAVAAHLEPEILVVDEVLAVGDAQFQKKCLGKMEEVGREGRTVLFVSHNMGVINQLCNRAILLHEGKVADCGDAHAMSRRYLAGVGGYSLASSRTFAADERKILQLMSIRVVNESGEPAARFSCDEDIFLHLNIASRAEVPGLYGYLGLKNEDRNMILVSDSFDVGLNVFDRLAPGTYECRIRIPQRTLAAGTYVVHLAFGGSQADNFHVDVPGEVAQFELDDLHTRRGNARQGYFSTLLDWELEPAG